uniref:Uncharacterized protein n=1 Tax=Anopheles merus TaxID=30066 RepID=A0A182VN17_ANOME
MGNRLGALLGIEKSPGSSGGDGDGGSSKNYNLIESRDHNPAPPTPRDGGQSTVEQATVSPGSRLQRVRSFFLPSASRRREGSEEPPPFGGRSGIKQNLHFYANVTTGLVHIGSL